MAQMAALARDEEAWWQAELARLAPQLLLPGRPVRGGGRAAGSGLDSGLAIEVSRLAALAPALQRRLVRYAAEKFGAALDFSATEAVRSLALEGRAGQKLALPHGLRAERTARELRLSIEPRTNSKEKSAGAPEHPPMKRQFPAKSTRRPSGCGCASRLPHRRRAGPRMAAGRRQERPLCATGSPATGSGSAIRGAPAR